MLARPTLFIPLTYLVVGSCTSCVQTPGEKQPNTIPEELVGIWTTEGTVLDEGNLVKGEAFYLTIHGTGAAVGSGPPPGGGSLLAFYDSRSSALYVLPLPSDSNQIWGKLVFDRMSPSLNQDGHPGAVFYWQSKSIPSEMEEHRWAELWASERARVKNHVRDMNLYFPRLGYREMSPAEQYADQRDSFRRKALAALSLSGEPPLSSLGEKDIEVYRLIWVGAFWRPFPFVVRVGRNREGRVSVATTLENEQTEGTVTRRREVDEEDWATLKKRLEAATYFDLPIRVGETKLDRDWWIIEAWKEGTYQYVEASYPVPGPYRKLCEFFMELGGLDPKLYEGK